MTENQVIESYWIGLQRTKKQGIHLDHLYRDLFGQKYYTSNRQAIYSALRKYGCEITFKAICDLLDWKDFVPTRNITAELHYVCKRRHKANEIADNQPEMEDLTEYMKGLANVR